jgi:hypothetical protein
MSMPLFHPRIHSPPKPPFLKDRSEVQILPLNLIRMTLQLAEILLYPVMVLHFIEPIHELMARERVKHPEAHSIAQPPPRAFALLQSFDV